MAFPGIGHRLDDEGLESTETETTTLLQGEVPTLKEICLSTLERYIDSNVYTFSLFKL